MVWKQSIVLSVLMLGLTLSVLAQSTLDQQGTARPSEQVVIAHNRLLDLLRHPTFVTLRLACRPKHRPELTDAPPPYQEKQSISCQSFIRQDSSEQIMIWNEANSYYQYRPELMRDGQILPYIEKAKEGVERADRKPPSGSSAPLIMESGREYSLHQVDLDFWYGSLRPGRYQLTLRKQFVWEGDWVQSNPVIFEVEARKAAEPIPDGVTVRLAPSGLQPSLETERHRLESDVRVTVFVVNNSDHRLKVNIADIYYGNRLQLFKDGVLIPYRPETAKLLRSRDENPEPFEVPKFFLDPHTTTSMTEVRLSDWYGPLVPGQYRLISRYRFEFDGPWTGDSAPLLFEIPAK